MKILILTCCTPNWSDVDEISTPNKMNYAGKHGYEFTCYRDLLDKSRHPSWNKILMILKEMPRYDWIWWIDADSLVMNDDIRLESLIDDNYDFIVTTDDNGINCGSFLIRNCEWSNNFLNLVYAQAQFIDHIWWEQAAVSNLMQEPSHRKHGLYLPQCMMNSYITPYINTYKSGDFIAHFSGLTLEHERLVNLMKQYLILEMRPTSATFIS